jgi:hypothetical protein
MHESIRPVAGRFAPLALMGVRCFWPHNMIGHEGLVVDQALKLRSLPTCHQLSPRIRDGPCLSAEAFRSRWGQIVLLMREHGPGNPSRLIGERDNRPIEASPRREPLQPLGTAIVVLRQSKHDGAGAMNHLTSEIVIGAPAYSAEPRFASGRILTRHEANPRSKFPPGAEVMAVVNRGDKRCCDHGTHARQLREPPTGFVRSTKPQELLIQLVEPDIERAEFVEQVAIELPREIRKLRLRGDHESELAFGRPWPEFAAARDWPLSERWRVGLEIAPDPGA